MSQAKSTVDIVQIRLQYNHITGPSSSSSRKERLLRAQICENAIFDQPILRLGVGDFNVHEMGRDEDDDGVPAATLDAKPACQRPDSLESKANESKKAGP